MHCERYDNPCGLFPTYIYYEDNIPDKIVIITPYHCKYNYDYTMDLLTGDMEPDDISISHDERENIIAVFIYHKYKNENQADFSKRVRLICKRITEEDYTTVNTIGNIYINNKYQYDIHTTGYFS